MDTAGFAHRSISIALVFEYLANGFTHQRVIRFVLHQRLVQQTAVPGCGFRGNMSAKIFARQ